MTSRAVYDCMIYLQAAANPSGPAAACVREADGGPVVLVISADIAAEVRDVLTRPHIRKRFRTLTPERVTEFLAEIQRIAVHVPDVPAVFDLARDPKDSMYLNLAIAAGAAFVVSRDNDLLDLMSSADPDAMTFRTSFPAVRVLDPVTFLQSLPRPTDPPAPTPNDEAP